jgi:hypothetical protein
MVIVTTMLYGDKDQGANDSQPTPYWRASCALIDFGETDSNILISSMREPYASQESAHAEMRAVWPSRRFKNDVEMMMRTQL